MSPPCHTGLFITADKVRKELERLNQSKSAGPDGISPCVLKACARQLCGVLQHLFNLSLHLQRVPLLWKTSCLIPVPMNRHYDYKPIALTSHLTKVMERLVLAHLWPLVYLLLETWPLQFAYQPQLGIKDAIKYLLQRAYCFSDRPNTTVCMLFFDFSSAFNTIQPRMLKAKLKDIQVDASLVTWIHNYLTGKPQFVRLQGCVWTSDK